MNLPTPEEPAFADLAQLGEWLRSKKTSPTKLAEYFLTRLERLGPRYNAVVTVTRQRALAEAAKAEKELLAGDDKGPLHGIPYGCKDLIAAKGYPTTWGAPPFRHREFTDDATVVSKLREAGAVLVAKLATVELAGGMGYQQASASLVGPGLNPWDVSTWAGGSSSGSGAAVAAGLCPFALGSETWGSIITPAAYCGVTGLRPTYGRVSRHGAMALSWTMDKIGVLARSAADAALVLKHIAGPDPKDPTTLPRPFAGLAAKRERRPRVAVFPNLREGLQPEVLENYKKSLEVLAEFADIVEVKLPDLPFDEAADIILSAELGEALEELIGGEDAAFLAAPEDRIGGIANQYIFAREYIRALRVRGVAIRVMQEWLKPFDALAAPALPGVAPPARGPFRDASAGLSGPRISGPANLVGLPGVSVPNGFGERGLPTGLQFVGAALTDGMVLRVAAEYQQRTDWRFKHPKV